MAQVMTLLDSAQSGEKAAKLVRPKVADETEPSRLYPTYALPMGAPDAWHQPFTPKKSLPLTSATSRFLKRKPLPAQLHEAAIEVVQHEVSGRAVAVGVAVKNLTVEAKRKWPLASCSTFE